MMCPVLIITAHNSGAVPFDILSDMLGPDVHDSVARQARLDYLFHEGDPYTDALFHMPEAYHVHALVSRFVVDLNRRRDEGGLNGVIKLTDFDGHPLYSDGFQFEQGDINERLQRYYDPFHATIDRALAEDVLFFIDGHSMAPCGPLIGPDQGRPRPAFTIITGGTLSGEKAAPNRHTSISAATAQEVAAGLVRHFGDIVEATPELPDTVLINSPFSAGGIQEIYSDPRRKHAKPGFSLEFNRALYLQRGANGLDEAIPGRVEELNRRFQVFVQDLIPIFKRETVAA